MACKDCSKTDCPSHNAGEEKQKMAQRLCSIKHRIAVMSGKGGVGKSTVSVNLAAALAGEGFKVGLLDVDLHGPSIPTMLHLQEARISMGENGIEPVMIGDNLKVISIAFFLETPEQAVVWRGPMKLAAIKQMLQDVDWGELDYLIIDCPPGTGDEPLAVVQLIPSLDGGIIVTTPQDVASSDVRRSINFCEILKLPVIGVIENMNGFQCPDCGSIHYIFKRGGGQILAESLNLPFLGSLPLLQSVAESGDYGVPYMTKFKDSPAGEIFTQIALKLKNLTSKNNGCK
ncbi:MAG: Mrp/NBP35 family ATP-binding protein [Lentisphaerae bacterium]|jgi:Mrp family chromosome partitioning ATPase|nr:Mrp/NBP35 family ATP-binding protein [Victivallaceae bacterium]MDD3702635.1 Mrp/NBP35 family ATP-binding protein [Victivallaceae bacterium]MDD5663130.1 Mrp/NBP35 family ATP-binding protein [Victivallaceae bacterium]NLK82945.1 Mrp/NBP35 family ATP-binding protein [Lentisphaerota bacterium]